MEGDIQHWTALRSHFADLKNALDAVKEHDVAKGITALGVMSYLDAMGHSNICNLGGAAPGLAEGNLMFTAMASNFSVQSPKGKENCREVGTDDSWSPVPNQPWKVTFHPGCPTKPVGDRLVEG